MRKLLYIFLFLPVFASAQVQMFFTSDSSAFIRSPLDVDSLFYWFDASQGVFDSIGSPISNFQGVGEWKDLSGRGHHVTQTTNGARPQYQATAGPNNRPALYFDGTNHSLVSAAHLWESDDLTVFYVLKFETATKNGTEVILAKYDGSSTRSWDVLGGATVLNYIQRFRAYQTGAVTNARQWDTQTNFKNTAYNITVWRSEGTQNGMTHFRNNASQALSGSGTNNGTIYDHTGPFHIAQFRVFQGWISEIIIYSRPLTTAEREGLQSYLNHKYKIY